MTDSKWREATTVLANIVVERLKQPESKSREYLESMMTDIIEDMVEDIAYKASKTMGWVR